MNYISKIITSTALVIALQANLAFAETQNSGSIKIEPISPRQLAMSGFADIVEDLLPAVVNIAATKTEDSKSDEKIDRALIEELPKTHLFDELRNQLKNRKHHKKKTASIGSGFIISSDGLIVTNNHVVSDTNEIMVNLNDGSKAKAKLIGSDKRSDLALLKINVKKELKYVKFGDSNKARIGDWVIVIGNPYGLGGSVSVGIVSARGRDINNGQFDEFIQTDAAINKGSSGGPMFNLKGEVIGISTAIFSPSGGSVGIGFVTTSAIASPVVDQLLKQGEVIRGWLGVSVQDVSKDIAESIDMPEAKGAFVVEVIKDSPAEKAGILPTDIIIKFNDIEVSEMKILPKTVSAYPIGKKAEITVLRQGKVKNLTVKIEKMKEEKIEKSEKQSQEKTEKTKADDTILGISVKNLNKEIREEKNIDSDIEGILIVDLESDSEASDKGILPDDILLSVNQIPVNSARSFERIVRRSREDKSKKIFLFLKRGEINYGIVLSNK